MGKKIKTNNFTGGMNLDLDESLLKSNQYLETTNFRLILNEEGDSGILSSMKDEILKIDLPGSARYKAHIFIRDYLIIFSYNSSTTTDYINIVSIADITADNTSISLSSSDYYYDDGDYDPDNPNFGDVNLSFYNLVFTLSSSDSLFGDSDNIKIVSRYETPFIQKLYWIDGVNEIKHLNIIESDYNSLSGVESDPSKLNLFPNIDFHVTGDNFELQDVVGGQLLSGRIQYAYQLYDLYGAETTFSEPSGLHNITSSSEKSDNDLNYKGVEADTVTSKGIKGTFNLGSTNFSKVRVIAIHYSDINSSPTINIVTELDLPDSGSEITFIDTGNYIGTLTVEEYAVLGQTELVAGSIETKNDVLFVGNIKDNYFDVGDWDARSYRFKRADYNTSTTGTVLLSVTTFTATMSASDHGLYVGDTVEMTIAGNTQTVIVLYDYGASNVIEFSIDTYTPIIGDAVVLLTPTSFMDVYPTSDIGTWTSPEASTTGSSPTYPTDLTLDAVNPHNILTSDSAGTFYNYIYQADNTVIGATGPNVDYRIVSDLSTIIDNTGDTLSTTLPTVETAPAFKTTFTSDKDSDDISYSAYSGIKQSSTIVGYQRDEIYRFGILFLDTKGRRSDVKWIGDPRMPNIDSNPTTTYSSTTKRTSANILYLKFEIHGDQDGYPTDAVGYQIVRVKRDSINRTIHAQGVLSPSQQTTTTSNVYQNSFRSVGFGSPTFHNGYVRDLVSFVSPEISINKNFTLGSNDHITILNDGLSLCDLDTPSSTEVYNENAKVVYTNNTVATYGGEYSVSDLKLHIFDDSFNYDTIITDSYNYSIGGYTYAPYTDGAKTIGGVADTYSGLSGYSPTHIVCKLTSDISTISSDIVVTSYTNYTILANYVKDISESIYGGLSYESRKYNEYISCGEIFELNDTENDVFSGDTYISYFDAPICMRDDSFPVSASSRLESFVNLMIPVESTINLNLRTDDSFKNFYENVDATLLRETAGLHTSTIGSQEFSQTEDLFQYNSAYSRENNAITYLPKQNDFLISNEVDTRVYYSDIKTNGELTDSWTSFPVNNYKDVDTTYGSLQHLLTNDNRLYFWQDSGFGVLAVNDRSLLQDADITTLALGSGGVLDRYDYISTKVGTEQWRSILNTNRSLYWYFDNERTLYTYGQGLSELAKIKGVQKLFTEFDSELEISGGYNSKYKELIYTIHKVGSSDSEDYYNLIINELQNIPTSLYDGTYAIGYFISHPSFTLVGTGLTSTSIFFKYDSSNTNKSNPTLKFVINDNFTITKIFDTLEWFQEDTNIGNTFSTIRCYNDICDTGTVSLSATNRISSFVANLPRNDSSIKPDTTDRLRGKYLIVELAYSYLNSDVDISYINSRYRTTNFQ